MTTGPLIQGIAKDDREWDETIGALEDGRELDGRESDRSKSGGEARSPKVRWGGGGLGFRAKVARGLGDVGWLMVRRWLMLI